MFLCAVRSKYLLTNTTSSTSTSTSSAGVVDRRSAAEAFAFDDAAQQQQPAKQNALESHTTAAPSTPTTTSDETHLMHFDFFDASNCDTLLFVARAFHFEDGNVFDFSDMSVDINKAASIGPNIACSKLMCQAVTVSIPFR